MNYGAVVDDSKEGIIRTSAPEIVSCEGKRELVRKMRSSILTAAPILARHGKVMMPMPGGCAIGKKPIDLHLKGFKALGATVVEDIENETVTVMAGPAGLKGNVIHLDFPSVGATENVLMAATLAKGTTIIQNAAKEPEIIDLANFLNKMGACIKNAGTDIIKIEGVKKLSGCIHEVLPDRIETGTFMLVAAITRGEILIRFYPTPFSAPCKSFLAKGELTHLYYEIARNDFTTQEAKDLANKIQEGVTKLVPQPDGVLDLKEESVNLKE